MQILGNPWRFPSGLQMAERRRGGVKVKALALLCGCPIQEAEGEHGRCKRNQAVIAGGGWQVPFQEMSGLWQEERNVGKKRGWSCGGDGEKGSGGRG